MPNPLFPALALLLHASLLTAAAKAPFIDPFPASIERAEELAAWSFDTSTDDWKAMHDCRVEQDAGRLIVHTTGQDPYLGRPLALPETNGGVWVDVRLRSPRAGRMELFWVTDQQPSWSASQARSLEVAGAPDWQDLHLYLPLQGGLRHLRIDPPAHDDPVEIDTVRILRAHPFPLVWTAWQQEKGGLRVGLRNRSDHTVRGTLQRQALEVKPGQEVERVIPLNRQHPVTAHTIRLKVDGLKPKVRTCITHQLKPSASWLQVPGGNEHSAIRVMPNGTAAAWLLDGRPVAVLAPLLQTETGLLSFQPKPGQDALILVGQGGRRIRLQQQGEELHLEIQSDDEVEGPVVRPTGTLEQGLFAGLEYLGKGESSSSRLDIETGAHLRYAPLPRLVTQPLMVVRTPTATAALGWEDMTIQPLFATPDFIDGTDQSRMALRGTTYRAVLKVNRDRLEDSICWSAQRTGGLPKSRPPRTPQAQAALNRAGLDGPIRDGNTWGHCIESKYTRTPYVDHASTWWKLTGEVLPMEHLVHGGAHIRNETIFLVSGKAEDWLRQNRNRAQGAIGRQGTEGGFPYRGKADFRRGHFEDTASGYCAQQTLPMIPYALATGDPATVAALEKSLAYMQRFRTPRGAQTWEVSLHTPDILASAYLVYAYLAGYELTGKEEYLATARRWAASGIPFVYLWGNEPVMTYATIPVFGATHFRAPLWIGLPVQWCGLVYAHAIAQLAPHDPSFDWATLARGILHTGEAMQYPEGEKAGTFPDYLVLRGQVRAGPSINPCPLVSLRTLLEGGLDALDYAHAGDVHVVSPFPTRIAQGQVAIDAPDGMSFQVLVNGKVRAVTGGPAPLRFPVLHPPPGS